MGRWGSEFWRTFRPDPLPKPPGIVYVVTYTAVVDVDLVRSELRFNEALTPDEILKALLNGNFGSMSLKSWPPAGCTERNRFRLLTLWKIAMFLDVAECFISKSGPARPRTRNQPEPSLLARDWAYARYPATYAALQAGGGPYRPCTFVGRITANIGLPSHDYYLPDEGIAPPGLENDQDALRFTRALVQSDLRQRIDALT
jgi:hypothetical protein